MTKEEKFLQLLYRTDEIRKIMINDVYQELLEIIPIKLCFSSKNIVKETREMNLKTALNSISNFVSNNVDYKNVIQEIYEDNLEYVLYGYMFYLSNTNEKCLGIDIFKDKKSILYSEISLLDVL